MKIFMEKMTNIPNAKQDFCIETAARIQMLPFLNFGFALSASILNHQFFINQKNEDKSALESRLQIDNSKRNKYLAVNS